MSTPTPPSISADERTALRQRAEAALDSGDLSTAQTLAAELAKRTLGPWENTLLGRIAMAAGNPKQARTNLESAHAALPKEGSILMYLAAACAAQRQWSHAIKYISGAIAQRDNLAELHERHGIYLANAGSIEASKQALLRAIELEPNRATAWALLGERYVDLKESTAARDALSKSVAIDPANGAALWNLALLAEMDGDLEGAQDLLTRQIEAKAGDHYQARQRRGLIRLSLGDLEKGWADYSERRMSAAYKSWQHALRKPYWSGEDLSDKHLLVWADQGLGEQILTAGLVPELKARAESVTFACEPRLIAAMARSFPDIKVVSLTVLKGGGKGLGPIDLQASISELGAGLRPKMNAFPKPSPYLIPDTSRVAAFRKALLGQDQKPLIGISWRSENAIAGNEKSTDLVNHWPALLKLPDVHYVSLQYGSTSEEIARAEAASSVRIASVTDLDPKVDLDGFAALVAAMDAVVSTSNTTVHVAGALAVPTWAMIPKNYGCPWYWFRQGQSSPWYSNLTLLRRQNGWEDLVEDAVERLKRHFA